MKALLATLALAGASLLTQPVKAQLTEGDHGQSFDFGHVGIDFKVYHSFPLINKGSDSVWIDSVHINCDCSAVQVADSLLEPGDTVHFRLMFETSDLYGPTNRSFTVYTSSETQPQAQYFYLSIVGQWFNGIIPQPNSLFFLPPHDKKTVSISAGEYEDVSLTVLDQHDATFTVTPLKAEASSGEEFSLEIRPAGGLESGTYLSNFTVGIMDADGAEVSRLTIPVKIVRY